MSSQEKQTKRPGLKSRLFSLNCFSRPRASEEQGEGWVKDSNKTQNGAVQGVGEQLSAPNDNVNHGGINLVRNSQDALLAYLGSSGQLDTCISAGSGLLHAAASQAEAIAEPMYQSASSCTHTMSMQETLTLSGHLSMEESESDQQSYVPSSDGQGYGKGSHVDSMLEWHSTGPLTLQPTLLRGSTPPRSDRPAAPGTNNSDISGDGITPASTSITTPEDSQESAKDVVVTCTSSHVDSPYSVVGSSSFGGSLNGNTLARTGSQLRLTRRHTAMVVLPVEDEVGEDASSGDLPVRNRQAAAVRRSLSQVFDGHHVHLTKLRQQMGDTREPPSDLLSLMARRVFSQQGIMTRVNSEGVVSGIDANSSFKTPSSPQMHIDAMSLPSLPRIRTRVHTGSSAVA